MRLNEMISIITVVLNGEKTIKRTLDSVCNQSVLPMEYIIVDGISTDSTLDIIHDYMKRFPFIKLIREEKRGIYLAMNKGIELAKGKLIGIINSDDWYEENAFAEMSKAYEMNGSGVYHGIVRFVSHGKECFLERGTHEFLGVRMMPHSSIFVSADVYKKHGIFDLKYKYSADLELLVRYASQKVPFYYLDNIIANFTAGGASSDRRAAMESLRVRKRYGLISGRQYYPVIAKLKLQSLLNI